MQEFPDATAAEVPAPRRAPQPSAQLVGAHAELATTTATRALAEIRPLTSLRGLLAAWVVMFHLRPLLLDLFPTAWPVHRLADSGDSAVDVFFLLSGFVIWLAYAERTPRFSPSTFGRFLWARLARLYPVHITQQAAWVALWAVAVLLHKPAFATDSFDADGLLRNVFLVQAWGVPMKMYLNYPAWSVSMEWFAYLTTPVVFALAKATRGTASRLAAMTCLWAALIASHGTPANHYFRVVCAYAIGTLLASLVPARESAARWARWSAPLGVLLVLSVVTLYRFQLTYAYALPLAAGLILSLTVEGGGPMGSPRLVYLGRASYSLYMTHALSITVMHQVLHPSYYASSSLAVRVVVLLLYVIAAMSIAVASYELIEEPARRKMRRMIQA